MSNYETKAETTFPEGAYISWCETSDPIFDEEGDEIGSEEYILIEKLYVPHEHRGKGVARKMLRAELVDIQKAHPGATIRLAAYPFEQDDAEKIAMVDLVAFYESEGFEVVNAEGHAVIMEYK